MVEDFTLSRYHQELTRCHHQGPVLTSISPGERRGNPCNMSSSNSQQQVLVLSLKLSPKLVPSKKERPICQCQCANEPTRSSGEQFDFRNHAIKHGCCLQTCQWGGAMIILQQNLATQTNKRERSVCEKFISTKRSLAGGVKGLVRACQGPRLDEGSR
jgi:hypothetical protein